MITLWSRWLLVCALLACTNAFAATIVVDTGHSATKHGSTGANGRQEYVYNRDFTKQLVAALKADGHKVIDLDAIGQNKQLSDRTRNTLGADLFISIHHDSISQLWMNQGRQNEFSGFAVFLSGRNPKPEKSIRCAFEVADGLLSRGEVPSLYHATPIKGENRPLLDEKRGIHKYDDLVVLHTSKAPALLVEIGVIVNPKEAIRLQRPDVVRNNAKAIATAITRCTVKDAP